MLCSDFPWNKHVYKPSSHWGTPMETPSHGTQEVAYVSSPPEVSWDDGGEGLVCTDMDAGVYFRRPGDFGIVGIGMWMKQSLHISLLSLSWDEPEILTVSDFSRMNTMEFWETRMIVSLFSVISRSHIVESRVMESYPVLPLQYLYVVVVSCRIFGVTMIYHSYFYRCL
jgi:hypothetical protein